MSGCALQGWLRTPYSLQQRCQRPQACEPVAMGRPMCCTQGDGANDANVSRTHLNPTWLVAMRQARLGPPIVLQWMSLLLSFSDF